MGKKSAHPQEEGSATWRESCPGAAGGRGKDEGLEVWGGQESERVLVWWLLFCLSSVRQGLVLQVRTSKSVEKV